MDNGRRTFQEEGRKHVTQKSERTQCPQNSKSSWLNLCGNEKAHRGPYMPEREAGFDTDKENQLPLTKDLNK